MKGCIIEEDLKDVFQRDIPWKKMQGKSVLVTGAYGMLASYIIYMLAYLNENAAMDIKIIAVARSMEKLRKRFGNLIEQKNFRIYISGLDEPLDIEEDVNYIIHAASLADPGHYKVRPVDVLKPNVIGSYYLLQLAEQKNVEGYLLFSSGDIYGVVKGKESISENDYGSMDTLDIHNCYSESKRMAETMCLAWQQQKGIPVTIARICHTYAPTMDIEHDPRVFASFVNDILKGQDIVMKSDGSSKRTFCYIADALAAFFFILLCGKHGEAYNVCNTKEFYSIAKLADTLAGLYPESRIRVVRREREMDDMYVENSAASSIPYDNSKLKQLGWEAKYGIRQGFKRAVEGVRQLAGCSDKEGGLCKR